MEKEEDRIVRLFESVAPGVPKENKHIRRVFSILTRTTLHYRDQVLESTGRTVTVEDVREALDWLVPALFTGRFPETGDPIRLNLLNLWLKELKQIGNSRDHPE